MPSSPALRLFGGGPFPEGAPCRLAGKGPWMRRGVPVSRCRDGAFHVRVRRAGGGGSGAGWTSHVRRRQSPPPWAPACAGETGGVGMGTRVIRSSPEQGRPWRPASPALRLTGGGLNPEGAPPVLSAEAVEAPDFPTPCYRRGPVSRGRAGTSHVPLRRAGVGGYGAGWASHVPVRRLVSEGCGADWASHLRRRQSPPPWAPACAGETGGVGMGTRVLRSSSCRQRPWIPPNTARRPSGYGPCPEGAPSHLTGVGPWMRRGVPVARGQAGA